MAVLSHNQLHLRLMLITIASDVCNRTGPIGYLFEFIVEGFANTALTDFVTTSLINCLGCQAVGGNVQKSSAMKAGATNLISRNPFFLCRAKVNYLLFVLKLYFIKPY